MNIDERLQNLTVRLELLGREIQELRQASQRDGVKIRALLRVAESHDQHIP